MPLVISNSNINQTIISQKLMTSKALIQVPATFMDELHLNFHIPQFVSPDSPNFNISKLTSPNLPKFNILKLVSDLTHPTLNKFKNVWLKSVT